MEAEGAREALEKLDLHGQSAITALVADKNVGLKKFKNSYNEFKSILVRADSGHFAKNRRK